MKNRLLILLLLLPLFILPLAGVGAALTVSTVQSTTTTVGAYDRMGIAIGAGLSIGLAALGLD